MKQQPESISRDLDDEVAEAVEHQYARRMVKPRSPNAGASPTREAGTAQGASKADADKQLAGTTDEQRRTRES
jgi:hypothetical protein